MFGESMTTMPSLWASMYSWFTPTVLFVFLNLMIGTIAITSSLTARKPSEENQQQQQNRQFGRSPSVLQRLKSINLYSYKAQEPVFAYEKSPEINTHFSFQQTPEQQNPPYEQPSYFSRSPSMINRLKSFNLYNYISQEPVSPLPANSPLTEQTEETKPIRYDTDEVHAPEESSPQPEEKEEMAFEGEEQSLDEVYSKLKEAHVSRTKSDTKPASGEIPKKLPKKMRKSASTKSAFAHFEENDIVEARRPATVKESKGKFAEDDEEDDDGGEVDAKADDFINKFKHQLKLQRMDSILKYKNNIKKGGEK